MTTLKSARARAAIAILQENEKLRLELAAYQSAYLDEKLIISKSKIRLEILINKYHSSLDPKLTDHLIDLYNNL